MEKLQFTKEADGAIEGLYLDSIEAGKYTGFIFKDDNGDDWRCFYRGFVLPHTSYCFMDYTGYHISDDDMHEIVKKKCNGQRSTAKMTGDQWRRMMFSLQSYTINVIHGCWPF